MPFWSVNDFSLGFAALMDSAHSWRLFSSIIYDILIQIDKWLEILSPSAAPTFICIPQLHFPLWL